MNLQTFRAATMADALSQVKREMGIDAIILHTRTIQQRFWLGLRRKELIEITAGRGTRIADRHPRRTPAATVPSGPYANSVPRAAAVELAARAPAPVATATRSLPVNVVENSRQLMHTPAFENIVMKDLSREVGSLKTLLNDLLRDQKHRQAPSIPEDLFDHFQHLIDNEVDEATASDIIKTVHKNCRAEHLNNAAFVREKVIDGLEKLIPVSGPLVMNRSKTPHVVALIGPTGVGKTTTIAKLAANLKLKEKHRVGLITLDTYRIGAIDQLKRYADILAAPFRVVGSEEDMRTAIAGMSDCDFILIDTAGRSPTDTMKLNELKGFLSAAAPDEVHLVLSCTASVSCAASAITNFGQVRVDKIIFTKIDEAPFVGGLLNTVRKMNKSVSYITTGQDVPDDIEVGNARRIATLIVGKGTA